MNQRLALIIRKRKGEDVDVTGWERKQRRGRGPLWKRELPTTMGFHKHISGVWGLLVST